MLRVSNALLQQHRRAGMKLNQIAVAVAAAVLSTSAFAGGGEHAKQQPRAESGNGAMMQSQSGPQKAQGGHQQAQAQSPELVKQAQQALNEKGLNPGPVDGQWGPQTQQAVKAYQQQNQIQRSEERRVGKERRCRWARDCLKKEVPLTTRT